MNLIKIYRELAKSGIVTLVLISVLGGYFIGHPFEQAIDWKKLGLTLLGILLLSSGSSALNQYQERDLDAQMPRTAQRPLPSGRISELHALSFIIISISVGLGILYWGVNTSITLLGAVAAFSYNGLYTLWWKKKLAYAAIPGAIPGALPILMGYAAAAGQIITPGGLYLFFILFYWQMPHFWSLAIRFRKDYEQGGFPTLPVARGLEITVQQISRWTWTYVLLACSAPFFIPVKWIYLSIAIIMSLKLFWELRLFKQAPESKRWLHFFLWINFSLIIYIAAIAVDLWSVYLVPMLTR